MFFFKFNRGLSFDVNVSGLESYVADINAYGRLLSNSEEHYNPPFVPQNLMVCDFAKETLVLISLIN